MDTSKSRRRLLRALAAGVTTGVAGCGGRQGGTAESPTESDDGPGTGGRQTTSPTPPSTPVVGLETVAGGLDAPVDVLPVPGQDRRLVLEQGGVVRVHESDGFRDASLLDLGDQIAFGAEMGLLGAAFHPMFPEDPRLFVRYSTPLRSGAPENYSHTFVLASFEVAEDGRTARSDSERSVLEIHQPQGNHNAGDLVFGPDGLLYVAVGDGGAGGDRGRGHADDWYDAVEGGNGQDVTENLLGSVLRIDVDAGGPGEYGIPDDNPLVGEAGLDEHFAWGLRNPWRMSFDGDRLIAGDVGQNAWEEVDVVEKGGNYGWNVKEGTHCYGADSCPDETTDGEPLLDPVLEYPHGDAPVSGLSVIGGYVYRGDAIPALQGTYVFADYAARGRLFAATPSGDTWSKGVLTVAEGDRSKVGRVRSFARASDGELLVVGRTDEGEGVVNRVVV